MTTALFFIGGLALLVLGAEFLVRGASKLALRRGSHRLRLRGPKGASDEFLLAATVQNLRRMAKRWLESQPTAMPMAV